MDRLQIYIYAKSPKLFAFVLSAYLHLYVMYWIWRHRAVLKRRVKI